MSKDFKKISSGMLGVIFSLNLFLGYDMPLVKASTIAKEITDVYGAWENTGYKGEGIVIAVIDSGVDINHKDMKLTNPLKGKLSKDKVDDIIASGKLHGEGKFFTDKVPFAYNYADKNLHIKDTSKSNGMHGMHVAGIAAANATENETKEGKGIQGVAPESQIISMRVFSENPKNPYVSVTNVIKAIEDSIVLGADVINISLAIEAGFAEDDFIAEYAAIKKATDAGIVVVCGAGNEGYNTYPNKYPEIPDTGTVGTPGAYRDSISVGACENHKLNMVLFNYDTELEKGEMPYSFSDVDPTKGIIKKKEHWSEPDENGNRHKIVEEELVGKLDGNYELVDAGYGTRKELGKLGREKLAGKIALIKRGKEEYKTMKRWASINKAAGIIIYNKDGCENVETMFKDGDKYPTMFIGNSNGEKLKALIESGVKVSFNGTEKIIENFNKGGLYTLSSWGPTPSLDFKPDIIAPGGHISSTINDNQYKVMNGTSMATPHISGIVALLSEATRKNGIDLEGRELAKYYKNTIMNTSIPWMDKNCKEVPFSPRRQGAGVAQAHKAVINKVIVTDEEGNPSKALKEIGRHASFNLILKNYGTKDATYKLNDFGGVYSEVHEKITEENSKDGKGTPNEIKIEGAKIDFNKDTITIKGKSEEKIKVTITLPEDFESERFVEGYIRFISNDEDKNPSITLPYMGFYGDWSKPQIMDKPLWNKGNYTHKTALVDPIDGLGYGVDYELGWIKGTGEKLIVKEENIAISPNGDNNMDSAMPRIWFLRGARRVTAQVIDENKNIIRNLGHKEFVRRGIPGGKPEYLKSAMWDGIVSAQGEVAKEGKYFIRIIAEPDDINATKQIMDIPLKVDLTKPQVQLLSREEYVDSPYYKLKWKAEDLGSGLNSIDEYGEAKVDFMINKNTEYKKPYTFLDVDGYVEKNAFIANIGEFLEYGKNEIEFYIVDNAGNANVVKKQIKKVDVIMKLKDKKIQDGNLKINLEALNILEKKREGKLIIAQYDKNNKIIGKKVIDKLFKEYSGAYENFSEEIKLELDTSKIKCFLWDGVEGQKPFSDPIEFFMHL